MKKFVLLVLAALCVAVPVFAATEVSTVLQATVGASLSITTTIPGTKALDPSQTSATLGAVTISSNVANWKIVFHSANGGKMVSSTNNYPYLLNFGSTTGIDLSTDYEIVKTAPQPATTTTVSVTYQTAAELGLPAGTYEDTLTISLVAL